MYILKIMYKLACMKKRPEVPILPKLPKHFTDSLQKVVKRIHGRSISNDYAKEFNLSKDEASALLQYLFDTGMVTMKWLPEQNSLCFIEKELSN